MNILRLGVALLLALPQLAAAQTISNVTIGGPLEGAAGATATFAGASSLAVDSAGNLYLADSNRVLRMNVSDGTLHVVAGTGATGSPVDGVPGPQSPLGGELSIALDASDNVLIADSARSRIRRVDHATGIITTILQLSNTVIPAVAADTAGNIYYSGGQTIYRLLLPGNGAEMFTFTGITNSSGLALDAAGNLYVSSPGTHQVMKYSISSGTTTVMAGTGVRGFSGDGAAATAAELNTPFKVSIDAAGNVYFIDLENRRVRRIEAATGNISTVAGGGTGGDGGAATAAYLVWPRDIAVHGSRLYISEAGGRVRMVEGGIISTHAGGGGGPAVSPRLNGGPMAFDAAGNLYLVSRTLQRVYRVDANTGGISTVAGNGMSSPSPFGTETGNGDGGPATSAYLSPGGLAFGSSGDLFISDNGYHRVRRVDAVTGTITTYVEAPEIGNTAPDSGPGPIAFDPDGNLHLSADRRVRKVDKTTLAITTVAGGGTLVRPTSAVPATNYRFQRLTPSIGFDPAGRLHVGDDLPLRVEAGMIARFSETPIATYNSMALDAGGNVYLADTGNHLVRRIAAADGRLTVLAGTRADSNFAGDGGPYANTANLSSPDRLAFGADGHLYIGHGDGSTRIRKVNFDGVAANPPAVAFASRLPQTTSLPEQVVLTNLGPNPATLNALSLPANFAVTHDCGAAIAARASCVASVTFTPPAVGNSGGTLDVDASLVAQDVPVSGTGEISLVTHYYESIMRRAPDTEGKTFWDGERSRMQVLGASVNESWFAMSSYFLASPEYVGLNRNPTDFTTDLYRTFFNRAPDASGQQFWIDQMAAGMPREVVIASFQHSPEFATFTQGLFGDTAARAEVNIVMDFYRGLMGRLPDNNGFNAWVASMRQAQCQGASQVAAAAEGMSETFATSTEYASKNRTSAQYVGDLYNAFMRRGGDLTGVLGWIAGLDNGTYTRKQVRDSFRSSSEFQARIAAVVNQGCI